MIPAVTIKGELHVQCHRCQSYFIRHNASTDACDFIEGACACGAWHFIDEDIRCKPCMNLVKLNYDPPPLHIPPPGPDHDVYKGGFPR